jgi:hypothetical protein
MMYYVYICVDILLRISIIECGKEIIVGVSLSVYHGITASGMTRMTGIHI